MNRATIWPLRGAAPVPRLLYDPPFTQLTYPKPDDNKPEVPLRLFPWPVTEVVQGDMRAAMDRIRAASDGYVLVLGSGALLTQMAALGLVDEYRILVNPVLLGSGRPLFGKLAKPLEMNLVRTRPFGSGVVALYYQLES